MAFLSESASSFDLSQLLSIGANPLIPEIDRTSLKASGLGQLPVIAEKEVNQISTTSWQDIASGSQSSLVLKNLEENAPKALASSTNKDPLTGLLANQPLLGDADGDGDIDTNDVTLILKDRNQSVVGLNDPRDFDQDGRISIFDARKLGLAITTNTDKTAPTISAALLNDTAPNGSTNTDGITFDASIGGTIADLSQVTRFQAGFNTTPVENFVNVLDSLGEDGNFSLNLAQLEQINGRSLVDGEYTLHLQAQDQGNLSSELDLSFTLDRIAPDLTIANPLEGQKITTGAPLTGKADGTGSTIANVSYQFNGLTPVTLAVSSTGEFDSTLDVSQVDGAQTLAVSATDLAGNATTTNLNVEVLASDVPFFASELQLSEDGLLVGETTEIGFNVAIANPLGLSQVQVFEVDSQGNLIAFGTLYDNGDLTKGDDIAGDGSYNNKFVLSATSPAEKSYVAVIPVTQEKTAPAVIDIVAPISDAEFQAILDFNTQTETQLSTLLTSGVSVEQALAQVKATLEASPDQVKSNSIVTTERSIAWESQLGILSVLNADTYLDDGQQKAGGGSSTVGQDTFATETISNLAAVEADGECNKALVLSPYAYQFEPLDEANEIAQKLRDGGFDVVEKSNTTSAQSNITINDFKHLEQYDAIAISAHGDNFDGTNFGNGNEIVILTGQKATIFNKLVNIVDLLTGRLALASDTYAVTSSFITKYTDKMPESIVYVSSCRSTFTPSLGNAFLSEGAKAFIGYSDYVNPNFSDPRGKQVFDTLLQGKTTGDISGINTDQETDSDPALFQLIGSDKATLSIAKLNNGDFEKGNFRCWETEGDARIITALGPLSPPGGTRMAIISTGLGSVSDSQSSISQTFLVADNADKLQLTYNVISEEPLEFVGSQFDDKFQVLLDGTEIAFESINTSSWSAISGIDFAGGDATVYQTGFKTINVDLTAYKGKKVELKIQTFDLGDSIYDTATLVDNIKITTK